MTMELSMSIAIVAAAAISEFFTALIITLFVLVAEVLEGMTVSRGRRAIRDLLEFLPRAVSVRRAGAVAQIDAEALTVGDAVLVNPGGRIPVDGTVIAGHSFVDQSRITGESMPLEKYAGSRVFAGSINQSGALEIRAERIGRDTSYGKIIEAVEQAERSRAPVQRLADRLAGYLVYFALGRRRIDLSADPRHSLDHFGDDRGRRVRHRRRHAAGDPRRDRPRGARRRHRQGRSVTWSRSAGSIRSCSTRPERSPSAGRRFERWSPRPAPTPMALLDAAAAAELRSEHPLGKTIVAYAQALNRHRQGARAVRLHAGPRHRGDRGRRADCGRQPAP